MCKKAASLRLLRLAAYTVLDWNGQARGVRLECEKHSHHKVNHKCHDSHSSELLPEDVPDPGHRVSFHFVSRAVIEARRCGDRNGIVLRAAQQRGNQPNCGKPRPLPGLFGASSQAAHHVPFILLGSLSPLASFHVSLIE